MAALAVSRRGVLGGAAASVPSSGLRPIPRRRLILYSSILRVSVLRWMPSASAVLVRLPSQLAEHARDEPLLELADGVVELDALVDHLLDELLEPLADHDHVAVPAR